jgi:hypothetical protein
MKPISDLNPDALGLIRRPERPQTQANCAAQCTPTASTIATHEPSVEAPKPPVVPDWLREANRIIRTKFSAPGDGRGEWDLADTQAYGKLFAEAGEALCPKLIATLRERHVWRPSVAEVRAALDELRPPKPVVVLEGRDAAARQPVKMPLALPSAAQHPGRLALRERVKRFRGGVES